MATDLTIVLEDRPGTLADAAEALGRAGINIDGICGFPAGGEGMVHVLVEDAAAARSALTDAGIQVRGEREVVVTPVQNRPLGGAEVFRRVAAAGANVDLVYLTADGRLVIGGGDAAAIRQAVG